MHTKVFVGNLSFKTKAEELASEFTVAGRVVSANIITRGPRSLGYGFVEMETEEEAQRAVTLLNKKSVDSREINVELAKPREDKPQDGTRPPRGRRGGRGGRGGNRGGRGGRGGNRGPSDNNNEGAPAQNNANNNNNAANNNTDGQAPRRPRFNNRYRGGGGGSGGNANNNGGGAPAVGAGGAGVGAGGAGGPPRRRRFNNRPPRSSQPDNRTPSPTTLFVANLPFSFDDDALFKLFKDHKASKAHVVKNRSQRSKGFGFVEFANEADQKAALTATEKLSVEGRELIVKVALTAPEIPNKDNNAAPKDTPPVAAAAKDTPKDDKSS